MKGWWFQLSAGVQTLSDGFGSLGFKVQCDFRRAAQAEVEGKNAGVAIVGSNIPLSPPPPTHRFIHISLLVYVPNLPQSQSPLVMNEGPYSTYLAQLMLNSALCPNIRTLLAREGFRGYYGINHNTGEASRMILVSLYK